jgi:hypothetical protein
MALRIRNNKDIKGFQIKIDEQTHSIKISQLADDTTLYFNSKNDISVAMNEIEILGNFSCLMINSFNFFFPIKFFTFYVIMTIINT